MHCEIRQALWIGLGSDDSDHPGAWIPQLGPGTDGLAPVRRTGQAGS